MDNKIKIALMAPYNVYPANTGGKKYTALFYQYLAKIFPVCFISVSNNAVPENVKPFFFGVLGSSRLRYANLLLFFKLKKIIKDQGITDLIMMHPYYGWLAALLKKSTGVNLSLLSHNIESVRFKSMGKWWWRLLWHYEKYAHRVADNNFFITEEDREFAIKNYNLKPPLCHVITYGIGWQTPPPFQEKQDAKSELKKQFSVSFQEKILLFNGSLDYIPNIEAVEYILKEINPRLIKAGFKYKLIICGKDLPASFNELKDYTDANIIYAGFVDDINLFFKGADIFLNPVITGGGIKTKLVEALGNDLSAVSCETGAFGVAQDLAPEKLYIIKDHDWNAFAKAVINTPPERQISAAFFNHFYWGNIVAKAAEIITGAQHHNTDNI